MSNCRTAAFGYVGLNSAAWGAPYSAEKIWRSRDARLGKEAGSGTTLTRADLADVDSTAKSRLSRAGVGQVVERVLFHMCHALSEGKNVKISGFGSFILRDKGERVGRNPKTGIEVPIAPRRVMTFRASQIMRDRIAK